MDGNKMKRTGKSKMAVSTKDHVCDVCRMPIQSGETYVRRTEEDGFNHYKIMRRHPECDKKAQEESEL